MLNNSYAESKIYTLIYTLPLKFFRMIAQNLWLCNICRKIFLYRDRAIVWIIFSTSSGLARCAFMPQSSAWRTSSAKALAVSAMMGMEEASVLSSFRIWRVASYPSIRGIIISISITSNVPSGWLEKIPQNSNKQPLFHSL